MKTESIEVMSTRRLAALCNLWNGLTDPAALKTDEEHNRDRKNARLCLKAIRRHNHGRIYELGNGALIIAQGNFKANFR